MFASDPDLVFMYIRITGKPKVNVTLLLGLVTGIHEIILKTFSSDT